jgi:GrpB-like predicted nucleotidyltransferase (UPF0157 family)
MFEDVQPAIGPYLSRPADCRDYDPCAVDAARQIASLIQSYLPRAAVEHIGSTAVPGCQGRGIVDLLLPIADSDAAAVEELLGRLGFQRSSEPAPLGTDRPLWVGSWPREGETLLLNVYLRPPDSPEVDGMRFFRACLRADPDLRKAYVARKREILADGVTDPAEYCRLKGEFLKAVLG